MPTEPPTPEPPTEVPPTPTEEAEDLSDLDQDALNEVLLAAIRADDTGGVKRALEAGADASHELSSGPVIILVSAKGNADVIDLLLDHGADPNAEGSTGNTPLTMAANQGHASVVEILLDAGVDPNQPDGTRTHATALINASDKGYAEVVELLLDRGADPNQADSQGETPLMYAALRDEPKTIEMLLAYGADVNLQSSGGYSALHRVAESSYENLEILQILLDAGADVYAETNMGVTPLEMTQLTGLASEVAGISSEAKAEMLRKAGAE